MAALIDRAREVRRASIEAQARLIWRRARIQEEVVASVRTREQCARTLATARSKSVVSPWSRLTWSTARDQLDDVVELVQD